MTGILQSIYDTMRNPLFDIENWKEIGATLSRNRTRTFLTAFGIFWGTAMLAMLWGGAQGLQGMMRSQFEGFASNTALVYSEHTSIPYKGFKKGTYWRLDMRDLNDIREKVPELKVVTGISSRWGVTATYGRHHSSTRIKGVLPEYGEILSPLVYSGRFINEADEAAGRKVCVVGKRVAADLFGDQSPIGENVSVAGIYYKVVGVAGERNENMNINGSLDESIAVPLSTMRGAYNLGDEVELALFLARDGVKIADVRPKIERILRSHHPIHPDDRKAIGFMDISEMFAMVDNLFTGIDLLAIFVGISTLLAGIIGIGNIMWVIVKERTQEIGIRRAIGAKPRDIIVQILSEGMVLTVIAGVAGICFAAGILYTVENFGMSGGSVRWQLSFAHAMTIMVTFTLLGTAAGIIPAIKAMRIKPVEALNDK